VISSICVHYPQVASGVDEVRSKSNGTEIVVTATDTDGASGSDSRSI